MLGYTIVHRNKVEYRIDKYSGRTHQRDFLPTDLDASQTKVILSADRNYHEVTFWQDGLFDCRVRDLRSESSILSIGLMSAVKMSIVCLAPYSTSTY